MYLRFRRALPGQQAPAKLHDPPALEAGLGMPYSHSQTVRRTEPGV